jgi:hypothetical protein
MSSSDDDRVITIRDVVALAELDGAPYPPEEANREMLVAEVRRLHARVTELERENLRLTGRVTVLEARIDVHRR